MLDRIVRKLKSLKNRPRRYWHIFHTINRLKPLRIMEIGTWSGDRALKMIRIAQKYHPPTAVEYYGFDLFELMTKEKFSNEISKWPPTLNETKMRLKQTGAKVFLFRGDTSSLLPMLIKQLPKMDLIFIDGGHSLETIANDWKYTSQLMNHKTAVFFDDYWPNRTDAGAKVTVDNISQLDYTVKKLSITDHFKKTPFGELTIKLVKVKRK